MTPEKPQPQASASLTTAIPTLRCLKMRFSVSKPFREHASSSCQGEPLRRVALSLLRGRVLEIPGVDCLQARLLDREAQKSAARGDDSSSRIWPHVAFGQKPHTVCARSLDGSHARDSSQPL